MGLVNEILTVETVTQYGFRAGGKNYGLSPRLKDQGVTPDSFKAGITYSCEIYIGPKGGKSVNSFTEVGVAQATPPPIPATSVLPPTTVGNTPPPMGIPPVAPAQKRVEPVVTDDKMTRKDWDNRNRSIELQAILKSTLQSPALGQLVVGKNSEEALQTIKEVFLFSLNLYDSSK